MGNALLETVICSLQQCLNAMSGIHSQLMNSQKIKKFANCLYNNEVPQSWKSSSYASLKSLSNWSADLFARCDFFCQWLKTGKPKVFWLGAFMHPTALLSALLQSTAKRQSVSIDALCWDCSVINNENDLQGLSIQMHPKEGAYI